MLVLGTVLTVFFFQQELFEVTLNGCFSSACDL